MNRYENIPQKKSEDGKRVIRSVLYPPIPRKESDIYIRTAPQDRVELIAHQYYGDVSLWWLIAEANGIGKGTFAIPPGTLLRIPQDYSNILSEYQLLNE